MRKFEIGKVYLRPGLFIPSFFIRIISRTETEITFEEIEYPGEFSTYPIELYNGNERVKVWEYYNETGYMGPKALIEFRCSTSKTYH